MPVLCLEPVGHGSLQQGGSDTQPIDKDVEPQSCHRVLGRPAPEAHPTPNTHSRSWVTGSGIGTESQTQEGPGHKCPSSALMTFMASLHEVGLQQCASPLPTRLSQEPPILLQL